MCGRYVIHTDAEYEELVKIVAGIDEKQNIKTGEIFPTDTVPVLVNKDPRKLMLLKWGFQSFDGKPLINARSETIDQKPMFRSSFIERRCLVPANGYFEWKKEGSKKVKHLITLKERPVFFMAGLYNTFVDKNGIPFTGFVIITTDANSLISGIHDRMPAILEQGVEDIWLDARVENIKAMKSLLKPYSYKSMELRVV